MKLSGLNVRQILSKRIVELFSSVFIQVDANTKRLMFKMRHTWRAFVPEELLTNIDCIVKKFDPTWPITAKKGAPVKLVEDGTPNTIPHLTAIAEEILGITLVNESHNASPANGNQARTDKVCPQPELQSPLMNEKQSSSSYQVVPKPSNGHPSTSNGHSLSPSAVIETKNRIAGYRESASFLMKSADELEQLLLQQNRMDCE